MTTARRVSELEFVGKMSVGVSHLKVLDRTLGMDWRVLDLCYLKLENKCSPLRPKQ
jgi:hypothetical protein